jgi:hypothetical protein
MLRATDFRREHLLENDVKLLLIDACLDCVCDRITIAYATEDVDKIIHRMLRGDVILWVLTKEWTFEFFDRVLDEDEMQILKDINELHGIRKMYRIERTESWFDVVELKFNE